MSERGETLFLIRGHVFDEVPRLLADRLSQIGGVRVVAVIDERKGEADAAPYEKLSLNEAALAEIGLVELPENWAWLYGDMCYHLAARRFPGYGHYALVESDVYLPEAGVKPLLAALAASPAEAIAAQLGPQSPPKRYSRPLRRLGLDETWGCIFPFTRVSAKALAEMRAIRGEALSMRRGALLNDEGVLAGAVLRGGFSHARLEDVAPAQVSATSFDTNPPHLFETLLAAADETRMFHPVIAFSRVLDRIRSGERRYTPYRLRTVMNFASEEMRREIMQAFAEIGMA